MGDATGFGSAQDWGCPKEWILLSPSERADAILLRRTNLRFYRLSQSIKLI
jgi:hypothetical protein